MPKARRMSAPPPRLPAPLYQGSVNTWECDDGGHLNVRFHFERAFSGLARLAHAINMPGAFTQAAGATLVPLEAHVRFHKEARPAAPLSMHGGVIALGDSDATVCLDMRHGDGAVAAAFTLRVAHVDTRSFAAFPWSQRTRAAARDLACALPAHAAPRSIDLKRAPADASLARARDLGATRIGCALAGLDQCDAFGRLRGEHFPGRVSDSVPNLLAKWRQEAAQDSGATPAGAVVEARLVFRRWPRAGDLIEIWSGVAEVGEKTLRLVHWLCDPVTGAAWASMEAVALNFDVATRKTIAPSEAARARLTNQVVALAV
jgi:acyl-CoA thioester hydrolase